MSRRALVIALIAVAGAAVAGWIVGRRLAPPDVVPVVEQPLVTVSVENRLLETKFVTRGSVSFPEPVTLATSAEGRVTSLPSVGDDVIDGGVVMTVDHRPVITVESDVVFTQDLMEGSWGEEVRELQAVLAALGYSSGDAEGRFTRGTAEAVVEWYLDMGFIPHTNDSLSNGDISAVLAFEARGEREDLSSRLVSRGVVVPAAELVSVASLPLEIRAVSVRLGDPLTSGAIAASEPGALVISVIPVSDAAKIAVGARVVVDEPGVLDDEPGRVVTSSPQPDSPETMRVVVMLDDATALEGLMGASLRVSVPQESTGEPVLAVPLVAVSAGGDRDGVVEVVEGGGSRFVEVDLGLAAEGFVAVTPHGNLSEGDLVVVPGAG